MKLSETATKYFAVSIPVLVLILLLFGFFTGYLTPRETIQDKLNITFTIIGNECKDCMDMNKVLKKLPFAIKVSERSVEMSTRLIEKYDIKRIPVIIGIGNGEVLSKMGFKAVDDIWILDNILPYKLLKTGEITGIINVTAIDHKDCRGCIPAKEYINDFEEFMQFKEVTILSSDDEEAIKLIKDYKIERFPALLLKGDVHLHDFYESLLNLGRKRGGVLVLDELNPPYYYEGEVYGLVGVTYIGCDNCSIAKDTFAPFLEKIKIVYENVLTAESGKKLINKYNITQLPTMVLSRDALVYEDFVKRWEDVGSIEEDALVFRNFR